MDLGEEGAPSALPVPFRSLGALKGCPTVGTVGQP